MSTEDTNGAENQPENNATPATPKKTRSRSMILGGSALAGMLIFGAVAGAAIVKVTGHEDRQALLPVVAISAMADDSLVAVKGKVVEMFGNKFIIADASSGRALVDTGPSGEGNALVAQNEEVTVQGRFDNGFVRAGMVIHADGRVDELRLPHRHGPRDEPRDGGPRKHDRGPADGEQPPLPRP